MVASATATQDGTKLFFQRIEAATTVGSGRAWFDSESNGTEVNRPEAFEALRALDGVAKKRRPAAIRNVLESFSVGKLTLSEAAVKAFIHAYISEQPAGAHKLTAWQVRLPSGSPRAIASPKFIFVAEDGSGGSSTKCAKAIVDDRPSFLKAQGGSMMHRTRHAVFESDILAGKLFERIGILSPEARVIDISANKKLAADMGRICLDMELVDRKSVGGPVLPGGIEDLKKIDLDAFLKMLVLDLIIGNADRRGANYFTVVKDGVLVPIPVDNNSAFLSGLTNQIITSQANFKKGFGKDIPIDFEKFDPSVLGSIGLLVADAPDYRLLLSDKKARARLPAIIDQVVAALDDKFLGGIIDALPREIVPRGVAVGPWRQQEGTDVARMGPEWVKAFDEAWAYAPKKQSGLGLFNARKRELKEVFAWRRDHLKAAVTAYLANHPAA